MTSARTVCASAPCKFILFGEHAVADGEPAIGIAIGPRTQVRVSESKNTTVRCFSSDGGHPRLIEASEDLRLVHSIVSSFGHPKVDVTIQTAFPVSSGLGTSASVAVALIAALRAYHGASLPDCADERSEIRRLAHEWEAIAHAGRASGIDDTTCTFGGVIYFRAENDFVQLSIGKLPPLLLIYSGRPKKTGSIVTYVDNRIVEYPDIMSCVISAIGRISNRGCRALERGDHAELALLIQWNQNLLSVLGASNGLIDDIVNAISKLGGVAKLTGGGQGGCVIALLPTPDVVTPQFFQKWPDARQLKFNIEYSGVSVEVIQPD